jgi:hypothetical protein
MHINDKFPVTAAVIYDKREHKNKDPTWQFSFVQGSELYLMKLLYATLR